MYGGPGKLGRGGGGGSAGKRNIHAPPINRGAPAGRLSLGGGPRGRGGASSAAISSPSTSSLQVEESFSLVRENPLNFGMAIKLSPDLVEEIKRVEAQRGSVRIKFDANANNPNGNVILVGDKTFKFTWSREPGDFCDIYEERQSGQDGNGLLVESGGTWRKLNVERELDESTKNHVKRRSEEAERKLLFIDWAIVLDHQNPSMKNQMKALAAAESTPWRNFKHRKEPPFKKPKSDPASGGPPKSVYKSGLPVTTLSKGKLSAGSPLSAQPEQHGAPGSPIGSGNLVKGHAVVQDVAPNQPMNKTASSDKEMHSRLPSSTIREKPPKHNKNTEAKPADLRSLMISLLLEHQSRGMSLKALEKAIGDAMPNSARQIEPILRQIATFQAPGRYFLKPGVEMDGLKKPPPQIGSSPEIYHRQSPAPEKFDQFPAQDPTFSIKTAADDEEQGELNSLSVDTMDTTEKIDIIHNSPDQFTDKKVSNNSEALAGSSSDSGSDSDSESDSSDSGSDSGSHSKSKSQSPVGSRSESSSDSDSDASSSSKEASDEHVDITTSDDEKESNHKLQDSDPISPKPSVPWSQPDDEDVDIGNYDKQDDHVSDAVEIDKDSPEDDHDAERPPANYLFPNKEGEEQVEEIRPSFPDHHEQQERPVSEKTHAVDFLVTNDSKHDQSGTNERSSKGKSKRCFDDKHSDERTHNRKRLKSKNSNEPVAGTIHSLFGESPCNSSPDKPLQGPDKGPINLSFNRTARDGTNDPNSQTGFNQVLPTRYVSDSHQPGQTSYEARGWTEAPSGEKRPGKHDILDHGVKYSERSLQTNEGVRGQKGFNTEGQCEDGLVSERRQMTFSSEGVGDKHATMAESHYRKSDVLGKVKEASTSNSYMGYSPKDNNTSNTDRSPVMNGRGSLLRREHSDLELGEFREPFRDETPGPKKQFERKSSFKQLDDNPVNSEFWNSDFSRGKPHNKITADSGKLSPPNSEAAVSGIPGGPSKRKDPEVYVDDLTRSHHKGTRPLHQHHQLWGDHIEVGLQNNKVPEVSNKSRFAEVGTGQGPNLEAYGDTSRKASVNSTEQQHDPIRGVGSYTKKESKKQKPNMVGDSNDRRKDASVTESIDGAQKKKECLSDENSCSYTKYEKEEPELKGPIKDASQYKEYVKEYQEKYESYCSLNKILESYRDEFSKLGKDLEAHKGRDMKRYCDILEQMRSSFRQCGEKHKRLKKIFVVLYEELKHLKQMIKDYAASYKKD
ncbi:dentin sialophosphoprotein [Sesamum indicum]|uniref:Dentin sialophosphoprotein n=1 Tax=Sesamum indicum TaxID=4182 RepID=A0A8M8UP45_SESIN|nr:dentin sialophosphoprotein [Sesamum indicum]